MPSLPMIAAGVVLALSLTNVQAAGGGGGGGGGTEADSATSDPDCHPESADAWNEIGHAYRKLGDMDNSFKHYEKALKVDPKHKGAHEYLGEAYLQIGDLARAEQELRKLDSICFFRCEEYSDLKEQIRRCKIDHPATTTARQTSP